MDFDKKENGPNLISVLTCPECGFARKELMPVDSCLINYVCRGCGKSLKPKAGDCCVFCSYGSVRCPSMQDG
ncbi:MAG: hypothetical protein A2Z99_13350 [Treponema sp. GWB1_62_6]|nr:MAG: hypothetical protein A2001_19780 [Treponema sp. GWC1_61_84]OHE69997.1 MAG: hypothetical protein A2Z99_13350 [Treponema sp. GWB1_62_6]OHE77143.1 MAG: hypothetical protein A2413_16080 [Treponema sp. RIFOXYC1_FULL_61_9]HCM25821.1 hypothetical protein [Treponema sp.]